MHKALLFFWSYMRSRELQLREREIVFLVVHEISDDYHPIAGPPGEIFEISLYVKSRLYFGALRQITLVFWTGIFEGPQGSGAAKSEPVGGGGGGRGGGMKEKNLTTPSGRVGNKLKRYQGFDESSVSDSVCVRKESEAEVK